MATSPIAAAGQASEATKQWWGAHGLGDCFSCHPQASGSRWCSPSASEMAGTSSGVTSLLAGLLILALAVLFSWPVIARLFAFGSVQASSAGLGDRARVPRRPGLVSGGGTRDSTSGVNPDQLVAGRGKPDHGRGVPQGAGGTDSGGTGTTKTMP